LYYKKGEELYLNIFPPGMKILTFILLLFPLVISFFVNPWWSAIIVFFGGNAIGTTVGKILVGLGWPSKILPIVAIGSLALFFFLKG
jgi:Na+/phosphate symporter